MQDSELKMNYYECKTNVEMVSDLGVKSTKRFSYLVLADSCTRAEQLVKAKYENSDALAKVTDVVGRKFDAVIIDASAAFDLKYYKIVYAITTLDDRRGLEIDKKEAALVAAEELTDATDLLLEKFDHAPVLLSVVETPIIEFIKDTGK